jgi:protein arginine kinase activator
MTCQSCRAEATVHLTENVDGAVRETHLCAACAKKAGVVAPGPPPEFGLDAVLQKLISRHVGELVGELARRACPHCGLRFMEFRVGGRLGCPADYENFEPALLPLLRRAQGATRHVGKISARGHRPGERLKLRSALREAIAREDYEEAARLRDRLRQEDPTP